MADQTLEQALGQVETAAFNFATRFVNDAGVRSAYMEEARKFSARIRQAVASGQMSSAQGAAEANALRNGLLEQSRLQTSDIGRAFAQDMKASGLSMETLVAKYSQQLYGRPPAALSELERAAVFEKIIEKAGTANPRVSATMATLGKVGKGLFVLSLGIAVYQIATSDNPMEESAHQGLMLGGGFLGSVAGGAAAGLICGPGSVVCAPIGAIIGGVAFAFGADYAFSRWLR